MNGNPYYQPYWDTDELEHHGIKGMKWGVRRYQNADGTLTDAGRKRLNTYKEKEAVKVEKRYNKNLDRDLKFGKRNEAKNPDLVKKQREYLVQTHQKAFDSEMKAIKNMSYKDMKGEKAAVGKQWIKSAGLTVGSNLVAALTPVPVAVVSWPNYANIKANYRKADIPANYEIQKNLNDISKQYKADKREEELKKYRK